jgi:hypothetical protein
MVAERGVSMSVSRGWARLAVAVLLSLAAFGCTGGGAQGGGESGGTPEEAAARQSDAAPGAPGANPAGRSGGAPGAPGAPGGNGGNGAQAIGAPVELPAFVQRQGEPVVTVRKDIQREIRAACGNDELCVKTAVRPGHEPGDDSVHPSCFQRTSPPTNTDTKVPRRSTLVLETGSNPDASPCPDSGGQPSEDTAAPDDSQPPPSEDTTPSEDSQPPPSEDTTPPEDSQPPPSTP